VAQVEAGFPASDAPKLLRVLRDYQPRMDLRAELINLAKARNLLDLILSEAAAALVDSREWDDDGYATPISWLREEAKLPASVACSLVDVGFEMSRLQRSIEAMERGEIAFGHLALMADLAGFMAGGDGRFDETRLLAKAKEQNVSDFRKTVQHAQHAMDPGRFAENEQMAHEKRFLQIKPLEDGSAWLRGWLEAEAASKLRAALEPLARKQGATMSGRATSGWPTP
jgi:hypothetical protein